MTATKARRLAAVESLDDSSLVIDVEASVRPALLIFTLLALSACSVNPRHVAKKVQYEYLYEIAPHWRGKFRGDERRELERNRELWAARGPSTYSYTGAGSLFVTKVDAAGQVTRHYEGDPFPHASLGWATDTAEGRFRALESALSRCPDYKATYDPTTGFPTEATIADECMGWYCTQSVVSLLTPAPATVATRTNAPPTP